MVELASWQARFEAAGYGVAAMTYDPRAVLAAFHTEKKLDYPLLQDIDARHVSAYGILNTDYKPGDSGYGVPHPGVLVLDAEGVVQAKFAYPGFRDRPAFAAIYAAISTSP